MTLSGNNFMLTELNCPTCGAPGLEIHQPDGIVVCKFCHNQYSAADEILCPQCETLNDQSVLFCQNCGTKLKRTCTACATENWAGAEYCAACGRNLDLIANMSSRTRESFAERLEQHRQNAPALKAEQAAQSKKQSDALWAVEKRERQRRENNRFVTILMIGGVIFLVLILGGVIAISLLAR
jgi:uncharacterized Zn finger protein (UPF0148 family)